MFDGERRNEQNTENTQNSNGQQEDSTYRMNFTEQPNENATWQQSDAQDPFQEYEKQSTDAPRGSEAYPNGPTNPPEKEKKPKRKHPYRNAILCAIACGVIIGGCIIGSFAIGRNIGGGTYNSVTITTNTDNLASAEGSAETVSTGDTYTVAQIAEQCGSSVVAITNRSVQEVMTMFGIYTQESEGSGSGVIVGLSDDELLIVTNYHVVEDATELTVCFFDSEDAVFSAQIKGTDANNDLAVVAISLSDISTDVLSEISIATIGDSDSMQVGDEVVAIGNALGLGQSVTSGIISAVNREVEIDNYVANLIQTDAAINPGNSGGALFNMKGELIGINSAKYASEEIEGMGFAIPTSTAQPVIENLMSMQTRTKLTKNYGCLNITGTDVTTDAMQAYGMPQGVYVTEVLDGAAAANAGIQTGDIITSLDGISVTGIEELRDRLQYYKAGETVEVTVARNSGSGYAEMTLTVTLDNASNQDSSAFSNATGGEEESGDDGNGNYYEYDGDIEDFFNQFGNFFGN